MTRSFFWKAKPLHWEKLTRLNTFIWSLPPWMITGLSEQNEHVWRTKKYVSLSAWQDNRNNQTDFKHNNQLWPQDGTSWSEMLYCTEHCCSEKSSEIALCFLTTPRWMQMNIKWLQPYTKKAGRIDPNINSINLERGFVKEKKRLFEGNESRRAV